MFIAPPPPPNFEIRDLPLMLSMLSNQLLYLEYLINHVLSPPNRVKHLSEITFSFEHKAVIKNVGY